MLQQTRVDQVDPYYRRFMKAFPSLRALASASRGQVLKQWEGLGYYARARRMHDTARLLVGEHGGRFPRTSEELLKLPGVGPYTAAAIASLAFNEPVAVVDGNVVRVLTRLTAHGGDVAAPAGRRRLQAWADAMLVDGHAGEFNEAMMELGATLCMPRKPACGRCPMNTVCRAFRLGTPEKFPRKRRRKPVPHKVVGAAVTVRADGRLLIARRHEHAMLGGLWEFPGGTVEAGESIPACIARELKEELAVETDVGAHLVTVRHAYSHFTIALHAHWARIRKGRPRAIGCAEYAWVRRDELGEYAFSRADLRIIEALLEEANGNQ
jgi:A/G-specific adenine glycosylase